MKTTLSGMLVALGLALGVTMTEPALGKQKGAKAAVKREKKELTADRRQALLRERFGKLKREYRQGNISRRTMWDKLTALHDRGTQLSLEDRMSLLQTQATMLLEGGYPITAAIYAAQAIRIAERPAERELSQAWTILRRVSEKRPIQNLLDIVADKVDLGSRSAPAFGSDWSYFAANAAARAGDSAKALKLYAELRLDDRYFFPGKYQQAMMLIEQDKLKEAEASLKAILYPASHKLSPLRESTRLELVDYALMALGRVYYERERFADSIKAYRAVKREGANFYDALFEQSWSFFMGGYPMHALGALHAVESPFYAKVYNPEAPIVRALVHYWLCRYEESRSALADFTETYAASVEKLEEFLDRQRLDSETAYQLFENLVSGVSGESLGIPQSILQTASEKDSMMLVRDQYASILEEKYRLETKGIFGSAKGASKPLDYMDRWAGALRKDIGKKFLAELVDMKKDYERLYAQAEFLYVELLMSEKDQLLGKELHASSKITRVSKRMKVSGWADKTQAWKDSRMGEYWWDEVGFYITPVESQCNAR